MDPQNQSIKVFSHRASNFSSSVSKWSLGNPRKRRELIQHFENTFSWHGMAYLCPTTRNTSICVTTIYRVFFTACFLLVSYSVASLLQENFSEQSTFVSTINRDRQTGLEEDPHHFPLFPRATICRMPSYKTEFNSIHLELVRYVLLSLGEPFPTFTDEEYHTLIRLLLYQLHLIRFPYDEFVIELESRLAELEARYKELKAGGNFDLRQFIYDHSPNCTEFFSSCYLLLSVVDCCVVFQPVLTSSGVCFTMHYGVLQKRFRILVEKGSVSQMGLTVDLNTPATDAQLSEVGFRVYLSDPYEDAPVDFDKVQGKDVVAGFTTTIKTKVVKTQRVALHTPWHGLWNTCPKRKYNDTYQADRYSGCTKDNNFYMQALGINCKCQSLIHSRGSSNLRICDPIDWYQCYMQSEMKNEILESEKRSLCGEACTEYSYEADHSSMVLGGGRNISRVRISHNSAVYTYKEYKKKSLSSLLSLIGGSMGLYLGASIITVIEIVTFVAMWIWYRLAPAKHTTAEVHAPPDSQLSGRRQITAQTQSHNRSF